MTDKYAEIRAALDAATPGPWERHDTGGFFKCVRQTGSGRGICSTFVQNTPKTPAGCETQRHQNNANSDYIAAANPEAIRALLAERDALREALTGITEKSSLAQSAADEIYRLRAALADMLDMYGGTRDCEGRRKDDYEMERIETARAALTQQEQGK